MPEGWKNLKLIADVEDVSDIDPKQFKKVMRLLREMSEALDIALELVGGYGPGTKEEYLQAANALKKFKEWK